MLGRAIAPGDRELYVSDRCGDRVAVWTRASAAAPWRAPPVIGDGPRAAAGQLDYSNVPALSPDGLSLDVTDTDNHRIAVWKGSAAGAPWATQPQVGRGPGAALDQFNAPRGLALSANGREMCVTDRDDDRVAVWRKG